MKIPFPCTACGLCCRYVKGYLDARPDGSCVNLVDNKCRIYETRPEICRVDVMLDKTTNREKAYKDTVLMCNTLQKIHDIDESYRL